MRSISAAVFRGIIEPEVVTLRVRVGNVLPADLYYLIEQRRVVEQRATQILPVPAPTAGDDVVNRRTRKTLVIEVSV